MNLFWVISFLTFHISYIISNYYYKYSWYSGFWSRWAVWATIMVVHKHADKHCCRWNLFSSLFIFSILYFVLCNSLLGTIVTSSFLHSIVAKQSDSLLEEEKSELCKPLFAWHCKPSTWTSRIGTIADTFFFFLFGTLGCMICIPNVR